MKAPDLATLLALEARLVAATEPDRELDSRIYVALMGDDPVSRGFALMPYGSWVRAVKNGDVILRYETESAPEYTASIDATVALIERLLPGVVWKLRGNNDLVSGHTAEADLEWLAEDQHGPRFFSLSCATAYSAPVALCLALVRAVIAQRRTTMPSDTPDLTPARLRELLAAATPGDWIAGYSTLPCGPYDSVLAGPHKICEMVAAPNVSDPAAYSSEATVSNAALIALAPALAARVIELEAKNERLRKALGWFTARQAPIQSKFDLYGPSDTAAAMKDAFKAARSALEDRT